jgi:hypothetical protein
MESEGLEAGDKIAGNDDKAVNFSKASNRKRDVPVRFPTSP